MLITWRARKTLVVFPLAAFGLAALVLAFSLRALLRREGAGVTIGTLLVGGFACWVGLDELSLVHVVAGKLAVRRPFQRHHLEVSECALGIRYKSGSRSARYVVYATDGENRADLGEWSSERGAERGRGRISRVLFEPGPLRETRAQQEVERVEQAWRAETEKISRVIDAYYQSPAWKRLPYVIGAGLAVYVIGMMLHFYFSGPR